MKSDVKEFNQYIRNSCWKHAVPIANYFYDLKVKDWARLSCTWHTRYMFGDKAPAQDEWYDGEIFRRKTVDRMIDSPDFDPAGDVIFFSWCHWYKKVRIQPPSATPPVAPTPTPHEPDAKKPVPEGAENKTAPKWRKGLTIAASVLSAVAVVVKIAAPGWIALLLEAVVKILNALGS